MLTRLYHAALAKLADAANVVGRVFEATEPTPSQQFDDYVRENR